MSLPMRHGHNLVPFTNMGNRGGKNIEHFAVAALSTALVSLLGKRGHNAAFHTPSNPHVKRHKLIGSANGKFNARRRKSRKRTRGTRRSRSSRPWYLQ